MDACSTQSVLRARSAAAALAIALGVGGGLAPAAMAQDGNRDAFFSGASSDGTRVFFETTENLVAGDADTEFIYTDVYERFGGTTTLVSTGGNGDYSAEFKGASSDGTRVFFETGEQLAAGDTDCAGCLDVYERSGGTTKLVSAGGNGNYYADFVGASADGTRVFFETHEPLVAGDTDSGCDFDQLYPCKDIYERSGGTTTLVTGGGNGPFEARFDRASSDGTRVFFSTYESLVAGDTDDCGNGYCFDVYERSGGTTKLASAGGNGAFDASFGGASADGTRVFFDTGEPLVVGDTDCGGSGCQEDVYERSGGTTTLISAGGNGDYGAFFGGASADGTRVFFATYEPLAAGDTDSPCSGSGDFRPCIDVYERFGGTTTLVSTGGNGLYHAFFSDASADGTRAFFETDEDLVASDTDPDGCSTPVFQNLACTDVYERSGGTTTLISAGGNGAHFAFFGGASVDGTRVFFITSEPLAAGDTDDVCASAFTFGPCRDVYERSGGTTTLISATALISAGDSYNAFFGGTSADGTRVFFFAREALVASDTDGGCLSPAFADPCFDVYERSGGVTTLLSVGDPPAAPIFSSTSPASGANQNTVKIIGTAPAGTTVKLYTDATCSGAVVASGSAATFASPGLTVSVPDNSTTTFRARAENGYGTSPCSTSTITYSEVTPPPLPPTTGGGTTTVSPPAPTGERAAALKKCKKKTKRKRKKCRKKALLLPV